MLAFVAIVGTAYAQIPLQPTAPGQPVVTPDMPGNWQRTNLSFGLNTYTGDQDSQQLMAQLNSTLQFGRFESDMFGNFGVSRSEGQHQTNQEEVDWAYRYSLKKKSNWFAMVHTWYEHDEISGIDFRGAIGPGIGVHAINSQNMRVTFETGFAATTEEQVHDQRYVAWFFDPSIRWNISKKVDFQQKLNIRQNLTDHNDVRVYTNADITYAITQRVGIGFGLTIDYDRVPVVGHRKTDVQTATTFMVALGKQQ